ncbi:MULTISPECIES: BglG family transcription antiterminator [Bacillus]|uniref:BglG family transcription antiterminator n=1 Tax=Bacillus TaxID=1386 RepID=UPI0002F1B655|nr:MULTISPECIES: BglG family transcription antiterminator [Bacillus]
MALDIRSTAILSRIISAPAHVSLQTLINELRISRRTVYYDIEKINSWLKENKLPPVQKIRGQGFSLPFEAKKEIPLLLHELQDWQYDFSPHERRGWIFLVVAISKESLYVEDFMKLTCVSRNTVIEDIKILKRSLRTGNVELVFEKKQGYFLIGDEKAIRQKMDKWVQILLKEKNYLSIIKEINRFKDMEKEGNAFFREDELETIHRHLEEIESQGYFHFTDQDIYTLTIKFYLYLKRIKLGFTIGEMVSDANNIQEMESVYAASLLIEKLQTLSGCKVCQKETLFFTTHLLGAKVKNSIQNGEVSIQLSMIVRKMVKDFERKAGINFLQKDQLTQNLLNHLRPAYFRIKYGFEVKNAFSEAMKREMDYVFQLTKEVIGGFEVFVGKKMTEDEIAFLAMHFGGWLKKISPVLSLNALIVCTHGIGTSELLREELKELFKDIAFSRPVSLREYEKGSWNEYDFVISTVPIVNSSLPVYVVNSFMTKDEKLSLLKEVKSQYQKIGAKQTSDLQLMLSVIKKHCVIQNEEKLIEELSNITKQSTFILPDRYLPSLRELLTIDHITVIDSVENWTSAIEIASKPLLKKKKIQSSYVKAMIDTIHEKGPYVVISPKVALPHADSSKGVQELSISLLIMKEPVYFRSKNEQKVNIIFVIAPDKNHRHINAMKDLNQLFQQSNIKERLIDANSEQEVLDIICMNCNENGSEK